MQSLARSFFGRPYLLLSLTSLFWAGNIVLGRYAAGHVPPIALSFIRWTGAFLIVIAFALPFLKRDWPAIRKHLPVMLILTLAGITVYNSLAYWGLEHTQAINALLITSAHPLLVAGWSFILYRERLTVWQVVGIALSLGGVLIVLTRGDLAALQAVRFNIGAGALMLSPAYAAEIAIGRTFVLDLKAILILAYITIFPSLLAYLFFNRGIELIGPNRAAPFYHLIPIFGSALAILFLGERFELFHAAGYVCVLAGIFIGTRGRKA
jgi:drug/metabolite transporter (DMT)-like permease